MTKQEKKQRKETFFKDWSPALIEKFYPKIKFFNHHIKLELAGYEVDYYPGAGRLCKIVDGKMIWHDLEPDDFLIRCSIKDNIDEVSSMLNIHSYDL